jgi:hypothetical protein
VTTQLPTLRPLRTNVSNGEPDSLSGRAIRFCVAFGVMVGVPALGWHVGGIAGAVVVSILAGMLWSAFRASADGRPVASIVPGPVRFCVVLDLFVAATAGLALAWGARIAVPFVVLATWNAAATARRVAGLLAQKGDMAR